MINYNKQYQNKLNLDIEYYKEVSRKYKIIKKSGEGKEYKLYLNKKIFEGEYLNRKRNGRGKEYYENGKLKYEVEYLNGKRWKGKGYNIDNEIILEIENGKGKEYYFDGKLKFEVEFRNERVWIGKRYNYFVREQFEFKDRKGYINEYNDKGLLIYEGNI